MGDSFPAVWTNTVSARACSITATLPATSTAGSHAPTCTGALALWPRSISSGHFTHLLFIKIIVSLIHHRFLLIMLRNKMSFSLIYFSISSFLQICFLYPVLLQKILHQSRLNRFIFIDPGEVSENGLTKYKIRKPGLPHNFNYFIYRKKRSYLVKCALILML